MRTRQGPISGTSPRRGQKRTRRSERFYRTYKEVNTDDDDEENGDDDVASESSGSPSPPRYALRSSRQPPLSSQDAPTFELPDKRANDKLVPNGPSSTPLVATRDSASCRSPASPRSTRTTRSGASSTNHNSNNINCPKIVECGSDSSKAPSSSEANPGSPKKIAPVSAPIKVASPVSPAPSSPSPKRNLEPRQRRSSPVTVKTEPVSPSPKKPMKSIRPANADKNHASAICLDESQIGPWPKPLLYGPAACDKNGLPLPAQWQPVVVLDNNHQPLVRTPGSPTLLKSESSSTSSSASSAKAPKTTKNKTNNNTGAPHFWLRSKAATSFDSLHALWTFLHDSGIADRRNGVEGVQFTLEIGYRRCAVALVLDETVYRHQYSLVLTFGGDGLHHECLDRFSAALHFTHKARRPLLVYLAKYSSLPDGTPSDRYLFDGVYTVATGWQFAGPRQKMVWRWLLRRVSPLGFPQEFPFVSSLTCPRLIQNTSGLNVVQLELKLYWASQVSQLFDDQTEGFDDIAEIRVCLHHTVGDVRKLVTMALGSSDIATEGASLQPQGIELFLNGWMRLPFTVDNCAAFKFLCNQAWLVACPKPSRSELASDFTMGCASRAIPIECPAQFPLPDVGYIPLTIQFPISVSDTRTFWNAKSQTKSSSSKSTKSSAPLPASKKPRVFRRECQCMLWRTDKPIPSPNSPSSSSRNRNHSSSHTTHDDRKCVCSGAPFLLEYSGDSARNRVNSVFDECGDPCVCGCDPKKCRFRQMQRLMKNETQHPALTIKYVNSVKGFGLFAAEDIPAGTLLGHYTGEAITKDALPTSSGLYTIDRYPDDECDYLSTIVDAEQFGNHLRFVNHSCEPNCWNSQVYTPQIPDPVIGFYTKNDVVKGEELCVDYGERYFSAGMRCVCGSPMCYSQQQQQQQEQSTKLK